MLRPPLSPIKNGFNLLLPRLNGRAGVVGKAAHMKAELFIISINPGLGTITDNWAKLHRAQNKAIFLSIS